MSMETNDSQDINDSKIDEDESPPFEPLEEAGNSNPSHLHEDLSFDSHTSKHSVLARCEDSNHSNDVRISQTDPNTDSQLSRASLSIMTDENSRNSKTDLVESIQPRLTSCNIKKDDSMKMDVDEDEIVSQVQSNSENEVRNFENIGIDIDKKSDIQNSDSEKNEDKKKEDKIKNNKMQSEEKKSDRNKSSEKSKIKEDKYKSDKDKHRSEKEKSKHRPDREKDRHRSDKDKGKSDKDKEKHRSDREKSRNDKDKHRSDKEKSRNSSSDKKELKNNNGKEGENKQENKENKADKHKHDRDRSMEKSKSDRSKPDKHKSDKNKSDKDKNRSSKSKTDEEKKINEKIERDKCETADKEKSKKQESKSEKDRHRKDKDNQKSESEKNSADKIDKADKHGKDKSIKGKSDKNKKSEKGEKTPSHVKRDSSSSHREKDKSKSSLDENSKSLKSSEKSSSKADKSKRKSSKDDHYNSKEKKHNRRSTDRDSNDGRSSKKTFGGLSNESQTSNSQKSSQESHSSYNSADSGNSDATEKMQSENENPGTSNQEKIFSPQSVSGVKLIKPKFASNFDEARRLMKIRKQISKLEKHNQMMYNTNMQNKSLQISESNGEIVETTGTTGKYKKDNFESSPTNSIKEINMFESSYKSKTNRDLQDKELLIKRSIHLPKNLNRQDMKMSENQKGFPHNIGFGVKTCVDITDTTPEKNKHESLDDSIEEITPPLKDTVITMESWNALEAKLNQEVVMVDYNSYECPDAEYDISPAQNPERKVIPPSKAVELFPSTSTSVCKDTLKENIEPNRSKSLLSSPSNTSIQSEEDTVVGSKCVNRRASKTLFENLGVNLTETENSTKTIDKEMEDQSASEEIINEIRSKARTLVVSIEKQDTLERQLSGDSLVEGAGSAEELIHTSETPQLTCLNEDNLNDQQSKCSEEQINKEIDEINLKEIENKTKLASPVQDVSPENSKSEMRETKEEEIECKYFEIDNSLDTRLAVLREQIQMLEMFILKQTEEIAKAKIRSSPSVQPNGPIAKGKKRGRPPNEHYMKNNKLRIVDSPNNNSTKQKYNMKDITMNDGFAVPLSLPQRENIGQKEENLTAKRIKNKVANQRYSSDDLYKPRPHFSNPRRGRSVTGK